MPTATPPLAFRVFLAFLAHFHLSEFALTFMFNPRELGVRSFLVSKPYVIAMSAASVEFAVECAWFSDYKRACVARWFYPGVFTCVFGEWLRKRAMFDAKGAFTHVVQTRRRPTHALCVDGAYRYVRHPGYLGWFIWVLGTQVALGNALALVAFTVVTWRFFKQRIEAEERYLRDMFPGEYDAYARRTRTWIPGIK